MRRRSNGIARRAIRGNAIAQFRLGLFYAEGRGVPQDDSRAVGWYRAAAEQGLAIAQNNLGWMYQEGRGVPQDYAEAIKWYLKACEQNFADAAMQSGSDVPKRDWDAGQRRVGRAALSQSSDAGPCLGAVQLGLDVRLG